MHPDSGTCNYYQSIHHRWRTCIRRWYTSQKGTNIIPGYTSQQGTCILTGYPRREPASFQGIHLSKRICILPGRTSQHRDLHVIECIPSGALAFYKRRHISKGTCIIPRNTCQQGNMHPNRSYLPAWGSVNAFPHGNLHPPGREYISVQEGNLHYSR